MTYGGMSAGRSAWLVLAFVVVLVVTMQVLKRRYDAVLLGTVCLPLLGAGIGVWAVAACRLGEPDSVWARWTYGGATADRAFERWYLAPDPPGSLAHDTFFRRLVDTVPHLVGNPARRRDDVVPEHRPAPSADATRAVWVLGAATALAAVAGSAVLLVAGVLLPYAVLLRAGRVSAERPVLLLATAGGIAEIARLVASGSGIAGAAVSVASLLALLVGVALLRRREFPATTRRA
jgi:hypothetical protein